MFKKLLAIIFITLLTITLLGVGYVFVMAYYDFKGETLTKENEKPIEVTLEFWGLWDNSDDWGEIIEKFENETHNFDGQEMNVSINYTKKEFSFYEEDLARAKEKNNESNIMMINNNWLERYIDQLEPLNGDDNYVEKYRLIKYEELLEIFLAEIIKNLIYENKLYGLPMSSDSLALFYNKDLFTEAEIENSPQTCDEFKEAVKKLSKINKDKNIIQEDKIKSFADGEKAMFIGYSYQIKNLLILNPDLNYGISKMPQLENSTVINFSNVWTPVVSKNNNCKVKPVELSNEIDCSKIAWSFLSFAAQKENAEIYLNSTGKIAARKDLIKEQIDQNNKISVFASQAETAINYNKFNTRSCEFQF
jgi:ABC-type glycerol-3-phosphate transport system substrate-binding protein